MAAAGPPVCTGPTFRTTLGLPGNLLNMLELLRQSRRRTAARLGVAFASLWLAFAAVPCSALEALGVDLGHSHSMPAAAANGHGAAPAHDCPHCPPEQPATATPGDCTGLDDAVVTKVTPLDLTLAAAPSLPLLVSAPDADRALAPLRRADDRPPPVPLNLRFCTFLE